MTYKELLNQLSQLNEEQLKVELVFATDECQVLDVDHPIIRF